MPRFTHAVTGVTVSVDDDTAANLDSNMWDAADSGDEKSSRRKSTK